MLVFLQLMANEVETHKIADQPTPPKGAGLEGVDGKSENLFTVQQGIHTSNLFVE